MKQIIILIIALLALFSCGKETVQLPYGNPPSPGFNIEESDEEAINVADGVMDKMGGRRAWDTTRYISWTFFGRRHHTWDKQDMRCRIEMPSDSLVMILDLKEKKGRVQHKGIEMTNVDSINKYVDRGYKMWINDSYWLVMPFKLKDSGVTLGYEGQDTTAFGLPAQVLELTFADVGVTPENKYLVYVDQASGLVTQWDYYANYKDSLPRFKSPWPDYKKYGDILLSGGQIAGNKITDIEVKQKLDKDVFADF